MELQSFQKGSKFLIKCKFSREPGNGESRISLEASCHANSVDIRRVFKFLIKCKFSREPGNGESRISLEASCHANSVDIRRVFFGTPCIYIMICTKYILMPLHCLPNLLHISLSIPFCNLAYPFASPFATSLTFPLHFLS